MSKKFYKENELVFEQLPNYPKFKNLTDKVFGKLSVLGYAGKRTKSNTPHWYCKCSCEKETIRCISANSLCMGTTKSCGCGYKDLLVRNVDDRFDKFLRKARYHHGDKYKYVKSSFNLVTERMEIICPVHGSYWQTPDNHSQGRGCRMCQADNSRKTLDHFLESAKEIHGDKYNYSKVSFTKVKDHVDIICQTHGVFSQRVDMHLAGHGCTSCGHESLAGPLNQTVIDRNISKFKDEQNNLYIMKLSGLGNNIYKIGISKDIDNRLNRIRSHCGEVELTFIYQNSTFMAFYLEQFLHEWYNDLQYRGDSLRFGGWTELFTLEQQHLDFIINGLTEIEER